MLNRHAVAEDAGVVDQHVEVAERVDRGVDHALGAVPVGDVVAVGDGLAAGGGDLVDHLRGRRRVGAAAVGLPPRSLTTTLAPSDASSRACSRPRPRPRR